MSPTAPKAPRHVHPEQLEALTVVEGTARIWVGRDVRVVGPGDRVTIPARTAHTFGSADGREVHVLTTVHPALRWDEFTALAWSLDMDAKGRPRLLQMAALLDKYPNHLYLAGPPIGVQKPLIALLGMIARLTGHHTS